MKIVVLIYNKYIYRKIVQRKLKKVSGNFRLGYSSELSNPQYFSIGKDFFTGPYGYFTTNRNNPVTIGNYVMFGSHCKIIGGNHDYGYTKNHMYFNHEIDHMHSSIIIEDGAWIGAGSTILSGAHIAEGSIVGASSLVNKHIPPYCIATGMPVNRVRKRFSKEEDLKAILKNINSSYSFNEVNEIYKKHDIEY